MPDQDQPPPRHHLLIAGTGRAGTSFLVRWLAAAGLRTHLSAHATPMWDDDANAGLEDLPLAADSQAAPYVMKSPWLVEVIDDVLANPRIVLDAVIIPMRDLNEAAASRVVQELQTAHRKNPWMADLGRTFEQWGTTPGGVVYSLDPVDQARLLAVSFHRLVQRLVKADVPVVLLDFPRLALDADYLFSKLRRFVPATVAQGRAAHAELADPEKIRIGRELAADQDAVAPDRLGEALTRLDAVALRREVRRLLGDLAEAERAATAQREETADLRGALDMQALDLAGLAPAAEDDDANRQAAQAQLATLIAAVEQRRAQAENAAAAQREAVTELRCALDAQAVQLTELVGMLAARDADREAAQAQIATLTAAAEHRRTEAERAALDHHAVLVGLRATLDARDADLERAQAQVAALTAAMEQQRREAAATLEARDAELASAQAHVAALTEMAERRRVDAEHAAAEHLALVAGLRSALDARAAEHAELAAIQEARDADLQAAQLRVATLTATAEQRQAEAEHAAAARQEVNAGLRSALDEKAAELAGLAATLQARNADLSAAQAQAAALSVTVAEQRAEAEHAAAAQLDTVTSLRSELDAKAAQLARLAAVLEVRDADLAVARAQLATMTAVAEQVRNERDGLLASWTWRAGQPLRLAGHRARAVIAALRPGYRPLE